MFNTAKYSTEEITKAITEVLNGNDKNPIVQAYDNVVNKTDLNNINDGVYSTRNADNPSNCPDGIYNNILIQITSPIRYDVFQILFSANARSIYIRTRLLGSTWYDWEKIATTAL